MSTDQMDETFAAGLRELLVAEVESGARRRSWLRRSRRFVPLASAAVVLAAGGGGIAYATGAFTGPPGSTVVTDLSPPVRVTEVGTHTIQLGAAPTGVKDVSLTFACLSAGQFFFGSGGAGEECEGADVARQRSEPPFALPIKPGTHSFTIRATPGARWRLTIAYASTSTTPWAVNASGQTYGTPNSHGNPDLVATWATNHRLGYAYASQLFRPTTATSPAQALAEEGRTYTVPVYKSDGKTRIGKFIVGR